MALEQYEQVAAEEAAKTGKSVDITNSERIKKFQIDDTYSVGIELDKAIANPGSDATSCFAKATASCSAVHRNGEDQR